MHSMNRFSCCCCTYESHTNRGGRDGGWTRVELCDSCRLSEWVDSKAFACTLPCTSNAKRQPNTWAVAAVEAGAGAGAATCASFRLDLGVGCSCSMALPLIQMRHICSERFDSHASGRNSSSPVVYIYPPSLRLFGDYVWSGLCSAWHVEKHTKSSTWTCRGQMLSALIKCKIAPSYAYLNILWVMYLTLITCLWLPLTKSGYA